MHLAFSCATRIYLTGDDAYFYCIAHAAFWYIYSFYMVWRKIYRFGTRLLNVATNLRHAHGANGKRRRIVWWQSISLAFFRDSTIIFFFFSFISIWLNGNTVKTMGFGSFLLLLFFLNHSNHDNAGVSKSLVWIYSRIFWTAWLSCKCTLMLQLSHTIL